MADLKARAESFIKQVSWEANGDLDKLYAAWAVWCPYAKTQGKCSQTGSKMCRTLNMSDRDKTVCGMHNKQVLKIVYGEGY